jgi:aldehyde:ferredoxin oxidoreductase
VEEYDSRQERYDTELEEKYDVDLTGKDTRWRLAELRKRREAQYETLKDAVYQRRGWTANGIPTVDTVKRLGIDFPEVMALLAENDVK